MNYLAGVCVCSFGLGAFCFRQAKTTSDAKHNIWKIDDMRRGHGLTDEVLQRRFVNEPWRGVAKVRALREWEEKELKKQNRFLESSPLCWVFPAPRIDIDGFVTALDVGDELEQK